MISWIFVKCLKINLWTFMKAMAVWKYLKLFKNSYIHNHQRIKWLNVHFKRAITMNKNFLLKEVSIFIQCTIAKLIWMTESTLLKHFQNNKEKYKIEFTNNFKAIYILKPTTLRGKKKECLTYYWTNLWVPKMKNISAYVLLI